MARGPAGGGAGQARCRGREARPFAGNFSAQNRRPQTGRASPQAVAAALQTEAERPLEAPGEVIDTLPGLADGRPRIAQRPRRGAQVGALLAKAAVDAEDQPMVMAGNIGEQFGPHRHRDLGGGARRRRTHVGGKVDQRRVGFVADGGNERNGAGGGGAHDLFLVEGPQFLDTAAAARDDNEIGPRHRTAWGQAVETLDRGGDLRACVVALHGDGPQQHVARKALTQPVQDVADDGAGRRGHDADDLGQARQRLLARLVEQTLGGEPDTQFFQPRQ